MLEENEKNRLLSLLESVMRDGKIWPGDLSYKYCWSTPDDYLFETELLERLRDKGVSDVCAGASKLVFKLDNEPNWVFKVPLFGEAWYASYDDEDPYEQYEFHNVARNLCFDKDPEGRPDKDMWNYCALEEYIGGYVREFYSETAPLFAMTYQIGWYGDVPVYVSERCDSSWDEGYQELAESVKYRDQYSKSATPQWSHSHMTNCLTTAQKIGFDVSWGEKLSGKLCQLVSDVNITDLHGGNLAFDSCGKLRLIDYSGYVCDSY